MTRIFCPGRPVTNPIWRDWSHGYLIDIIEDAVFGRQIVTIVTDVTPCSQLIYNPHI